MDLLSKFQSVDNSVVNRITAADRDVCEREQEAYDKGLAYIQSASAAWQEAGREEEELIGGIRERYFYHGYLPSVGMNEEMAVHNKMIDHRRFVETISRYFGRMYGIDLNEPLVEAHLLPQKPPIYKRDDMSDTEKYYADKYDEDCKKLHLHYEQILDEIFSQTNGLSLVDKAKMDMRTNLYRNTHKHYWGANESTEIVEKFIVKKNTLTFWNDIRGEWAKQTGGGDGKQMETGRQATPLLMALADYEGGEMASWYSLFKFGRYDQSIVEFPELTKVKGFKLYKSGRLDVIFTSELFLQGFVDEYLSKNPN